MKKIDILEFCQWLSPVSILQKAPKRAVSEWIVPLLAAWLLAALLLSGLVVLAGQPSLLPWVPLGAMVVPFGLRNRLFPSAWVPASSLWMKLGPRLWLSAFVWVTFFVVHVGVDGIQRSLVDGAREPRDRFEIAILSLGFASVCFFYHSWFLRNAERRKDADSG